ncbi:hypothetical protein Vi05172_g2817 [Venturia inaequalis]|nr:hypothetical protein Vi05172_g2817 [Venturia inaequalis]
MVDCSAGAGAGAGAGLQRSEGGKGKGASFTKSGPPEGRRQASAGRESARLQVDKCWSGRDWAEQKARVDSMHRRPRVGASRASGEIAQ